MQHARSGVIVKTHQTCFVVYCSPCLIRPSRLNGERGTAFLSPRKLCGWLSQSANVAMQPAILAAKFANRSTLLQARDAWCSDPVSAAATYGSIDLWDVSEVTDFSFLFCAEPAWTNLGCNANCKSFDEDINSWNTSKVSTLIATFFRATAFNHPLNRWDTRHVTSMHVSTRTRTSTCTCVRACAQTSALPYSPLHSGKKRPRLFLTDNLMSHADDVYERQFLQPTVVQLECREVAHDAAHVRWRRVPQ